MEAEGHPSHAGRDREGLAVGGGRAKLFADVFISCADQDREKVLPWVQRLRDAGVSLSMAGTEKLGHRPREIHRAIARGQAVIVIVSPRAVTSDQVARDIRMASQQKKPILPLVLDPVEIPASLEQPLAGTQPVELFRGDPEDTFRTLLASLAQFGVRPTSEQEVERIVHENAGLIRHLVGRTVRLFPRLPGGYDREDLESFGYLGLVQAARTFDPNRGVAFSTYAYRCIQNAISAALERANTTQQDVVSLSILIGEDADAPLKDPIADTAMDAEETAIDRAEAEILKEAIRLLPTQHGEIIWDVYYHAMPLNEVARKMKLSPQRVQAILDRALKMLRRRMRTMGGATPSPGKPPPPAKLPQPITDLVEFSLTAPTSVAPGKTCILDVWVHLAEQRQEVLRRAREAQGQEPIRIQSKSGVQVARGTLLTVRLTLPGFEVSDPEDIVTWKGDVGNARFPVSVTQDAALGPHAGTVTFYADTLQIAKLHFVLEVGPAEAPIDRLLTRQHRVRSAFASYASEDRDEVLSRIQGILKVLPNLDLFLDVASLRSGERWEERLKTEIERRDIFYLFWSLAASRSPWVEKEWRTALTTRGIDYIDPIPMVSPDEVPPPQELADHLHFNDWVLAHMRSKRTQSRA